LRPKWNRHHRSQEEEEEEEEEEEFSTLRDTGTEAGLFIATFLCGDFNERCLWSAAEKERRLRAALKCHENPRSHSSGAPAEMRIWHREGSVFKDGRLR
jgi:hypothetical protein